MDGNADVQPFPTKDLESSSSKGLPSGYQSTKDVSGQIIATSHDLTPNGGLVREFPLFQGNLGW